MYLASVSMGELTLERLTRSEGLKTEDADLVIRLHLVIVRLVVEGEGQHALLLQVSLVNSKQE